MNAPESIPCDLAIIGTGMAGTAAALFAANRGLSTVQIGGSGEILFASALLDLMGVYPLKTRRIRENPWDAIRELAKDLPDHPYTKVGEASIRAAFSEFFDFLETAGHPYRHREERNCRVLTSIGTERPTYGVPRSMWAGVGAMEQREPCLMVDIEGLKGFSARQIAETAKPRWPDIRVARISLPGADRGGEVYPEHLARNLGSERSLSILAEAIRPHLGNARVVGLPAILGMENSGSLAVSLGDGLGVPIFEIATLPPSIPGLRLKEAFERQLQKIGVRLFPQHRVVKVDPASDDDFVLHIDSRPAQSTVRARGVVLASGRFLGGGLVAERTGIRETIFGLPVHHPKGRLDWHRKAFLDVRGHPVNQAGIETDPLFRPLGPAGRPAHETLFAAGSVLAHQDWVRMKCGSGLALATAFAAVRSFLEKRA